MKKVILVTFVIALALGLIGSTNGDEYPPGYQTPTQMSEYPPGYTTPQPTQQYPPGYVTPQPTPQYPPGYNRQNDLPVVKSGRKTKFLRTNFVPWKRMDR